MRKLRLTWQRMRNVPGLRGDLVLLTALILVGVLAGGYIISQYDVIKPWEERTVFSAEFDMAPAIQLEATQEVRIAGIPVGKITGAEPTDHGTARITMSLGPQHQVYRNARAVIRSKTPINVMYVALDPGSPSAGPLGQNGTIPVSQTDRVLQPFELLDKLGPRTRNALTSLVNQADAALVRAPRDLPTGLRTTNATLASFEPIVTRLQERRESIKRLVTAIARISHAAGNDDRRLSSLASSLEQTLSVVTKRDQELNRTLAELPGFTHVLRDSMRETAGLTGELNPVLDSVDGAADQLPSALSRLTKTVNEAGRLVDDARPVVAAARPVVNDLRPLAGDLDASLRDLRPVVSTLPGATKRIVPWLDDLSAFVYQTSSAFSLADVNGGLGRAQVVFDVTNPTGGGSAVQSGSNSQGGSK